MRPFHILAAERQNVVGIKQIKKNRSKRNVLIWLCGDGSLSNDNGIDFHEAVENSAGDFFLSEGTKRFYFLKNRGKTPEKAEKILKKTLTGKPAIGIISPVESSPP